MTIIKINWQQYFQNLHILPSFYRAHDCFVSNFKSYCSKNPTWNLLLKYCIVNKFKMAVIYNIKKKDSFRLTKIAIGPQEY